MKSTRITAFLLGLTLLVSGTKAASISLDPYSYWSQGATDADGSQHGSGTKLSIPFDHTYTYTGAPTNVSTTALSLSDTEFQVRFEQKRGGRPSVRVDSGGWTYPDLANSMGLIRFIANSDLTFTATGTYTTPSASNVEYDLSLIEENPANNHQIAEVFYSKTVLSTSGTLDVVNGLRQGQSLSGSLISGHQYELYYAVSLLAPSSGDNGGTGTGLMDFKLTPVVTAVPLPASAGMGFILLASIGLATALTRRRRENRVCP